MKKMTLVVALLATLAGPAVSAEAESDHQTSLNAAITSDYRYRGISQTRLRPALQGGGDYTHSPSGLYAGAWGSTIHWIKDAGGSGNAEIDLYAGKRGMAGDSISYDIGVLTYVYAGNALARVPGFASANTTELSAQIGMGPAYVKYAHAVSNLFGFVDSKHSGYLDFGANVGVAPGTMLNLHAGRQRVKNTSAASYTDWKLGLTRDFTFATGALAIVGTNASRAAYASPANGKFLGRTAVIVTVSKSF